MISDQLSCAGVTSPVLLYTLTAKGKSLQASHTYLQMKFCGISEVFLFLFCRRLLCKVRRPFLQRNISFLQDDAVRGENPKPFTEFLITEKILFLIHAPCQEHVRSNTCAFPRCTFLILLSDISTNIRSLLLTGWCAGYGRVTKVF